MTQKQLALLITVANAAMNITDLEDRMKIKQALWEVRKEIREQEEFENDMDAAAAEAMDPNGMGGDWGNSKGDGKDEIPF